MTTPDWQRGRLTLPIEEGMDDQLRKLVDQLHPDAVRNSDGTWLPKVAHELADKVYSTYFPARGNQEFALAHPHTLVRQFLSSTPHTAHDDAPLAMRVIDGFFTDQLRPDHENVAYWQVVDRTAGVVLEPEQWQLKGEGYDAVVTVANPVAGHTYTVSFLAEQVWDSTQMYNYLTNGWHDDPTRVKERPYEVRFDDTWQMVREHLPAWLDEHPEVDVVRFTTFFYHFTLVYNDRAKEKFFDWFGYSASVSVPALEAFAEEYGYELTAEDFVDGGYFNCPFRTPSKRFLDWMDFQQRFVCKRVKALVDLTHDHGREAMMFLGDNWIGTEPYGKYFAQIGMDAIVGSVGDAATCRMISDVPGVKYTEGRFLPYFFPDVFNENGDPVGEANKSWRTARRAIVRRPLDRIGYGGYLSLAAKYPRFVRRMEEIVNEFRSIHHYSDGQLPKNSRHVVGIVNAWGELRSWQTHMVAHARWYKHIYSYLGVIESLAGLPFEVRFLSFEDVLAGKLDDIAVLINAGTANTAFSGGRAWDDVNLIAKVRQFVAAGGGFIGVGEPTAYLRDGEVASGNYFQLADVLGVEKELGWSLSTNRYPTVNADHPIAADLSDHFDAGERVGEIYPTTATVIREHDGSVDIAANRYGAGRSVYFAGLPYSTENARTLQRAIIWAATGAMDDLSEVWTSSHPDIEVAYYEQANRLFVYNSGYYIQPVTLHGPNGAQQRVQLEPLASRWIDLQD